MRWFERIEDKLDHLHKHAERASRKMTELSEAIENLTTAVQGVSDRVAAGLEPLTQALADANEALDVMTAEDQRDQAALDQATADLATALSAATDAASNISTQVDALNAIASTPVPADTGDTGATGPDEGPAEEPPVDEGPTGPAEEPPVEEPVDEFPAPPVDEGPAEPPADDGTGIVVDGGPDVTPPVFDDGTGGSTA